MKVAKLRLRCPTKRTNLLRRRRRRRRPPPLAHEVLSWSGSRTPSANLKCRKEVQWEWGNVSGNGMPVHRSHSIKETLSTWNGCQEQERRPLVETGAQGWCALGKLASKNGQLHYVPSQMFRCISSLALFTNAMQESNMGVKQRRITVTCNVQEKGPHHTWWKKGAAEQGLYIWSNKIPHRVPPSLWTNTHLLCKDIWGERGRGDSDGTAQDREETLSVLNAESLWRGLFC